MSEEKTGTIKANRGQLNALGITNYSQNDVVEVVEVKNHFYLEIKKENTEPVRIPKDLVNITTNIKHQITKLTKAKITATADQLMDDNLYPQFCQPGQLIFITKENKDAGYLHYTDYPGGVEKTINKDFVSYL